MNKTLTNQVPIILLLILPLTGTIISCYHAINIPLLDDYNFVFGFLETYLNAHSFSESMNAIFAPSNRMIFATFNLIVILDFTVFGKVDFTHFIFLNNLLHLVFLFILYKMFRQERISDKYFIPVAMLFAAPNFAVQNWACYTAHVLAIVFTTLAIWILSRSGMKYFWWALLLAMVAALSTGAGFLAFLAPIPILLTRYHRREAVIWGIFFLVSLSFYSYWSFGDAQAFQLIKNDPPGIVGYALNFILFFGSAFKSLYQEYHLWAGIIGVLICGLCTALLLHRFAVLKRHPLLASGLVFALLLATLITLTRSQYGIGATTAYRYRLYQFIPLVFIYLYFLIDQVQFVQKHFWSIICFSLLFLAFRTQYNLNKLSDQNWQLRTGLYNFQLTQSYDQLSYHTPAKAAYWLEQMTQKEAFDLDAQAELGIPAFNLTRAANLQRMNLILDLTKDTESYFKVMGWAFPSYAAADALQIFLFVENGDDRYYYRTGPLLNPDMLMGKSANGFTGIIDKTNLKHDWMEAKIGVALRHPYQGIIAESYLP